MHLEQEGQPFSLLLDFVEIPRSHTGLNLALEFARILREFGIENKILSVTCDNASNNDAMVRELEAQLDAFAGPASLTRCFLHVINLVAKTTIRVFDAPTKHNSASDDDDDLSTGNSDLDRARAELLKLAKDIELEDAETRAAMAGQSDDDDEMQGDLENSTEGWIDEREQLSEAEKKKLDASVLPLRLAILKVCFGFDLNFGTAR